MVAVAVGVGVAVVVVVGVAVVVVVVVVVDAIPVGVGVAVVVVVGVAIVVVVVVVVGVAGQMTQQRKEPKMKKIVEEVSGEGLESLLGENVWLWCVNYIYAGKLVGVNESDVLLDDAAIVYETGELTASTYKDAQPVPGGKLYVRTAAIEAYGPSGK